MKLCFSISILSKCLLPPDSQVTVVCKQFQTPQTYHSLFLMRLCAMWVKLYFTQSYIQYIL